MEPILRTAIGTDTLGPNQHMGSNTCIIYKEPTKGGRNVPTKLSTTTKKIDLIPNKKNSELIHKFHEFMKSNGSSERHQNNNLKAVCNFANYLGQNVNF